MPSFFRTPFIFAITTLLLIGTTLLSSCGKSLIGGYELSRQQRVAMEDAVAEVKPALVRIHVVEPAYYQGREQKFRASGSGTIITPDGHIVTNHHVAGKAIQIVCTMPNREEIPAELIGTDAATDIAIIKLMPPEPRTFEYAEFGDSDEIRVGDMVLALGSPLGLSQSVTLGIISNKEMIMPGGGYGLRLDGENVGELVRWFAHDAQIYPGNSGGPLVNLKGEIIGVNEISYGLAGAIPGNLSQKVAQQIIEHGKVRRAYVGFILQPLLKSSPTQQGVLIAGLLKDSPAMDAGFKSGDILLSLNGRELLAQYYEDLPVINNYIADLPIDQPVTARISRDGSQMEMTLTPNLRQPAMTKSSEYRAWGMTARDLTLFTQLSMARERKSGVLVTTTRSGGPSATAKPELRAGDIITSINNNAVANSEELSKLTENLVGENIMGNRVDALVGFERDAESYLTVVRLGIDDLDDPGVEVKKAWLPIETQVLTSDLAEGLEISETKGVRITRVYPDAPEEFPLEQGDIITHIDGDVVNASATHDAEVFRTTIRQYRIGSEPELTILRDGEEMKVTAELVASPAFGREMDRYRDLDFDFTIRQATYYDKQDPKLQGIEVDIIADSVTEGGWASLADLRVGDVILLINDTDVNTVDDVEQIMEQIHKEKPERVVWQVRRGIQNTYLEMEPIWEEEEK